MGEPSIEQISARAVRMNKLLVGKSAKTNGSHVSNLLNRECLLDSLFVLFEECDKEELRKDKNIYAFVDKFRPIIIEYKKLRVNHNDFEIKQVIGTGHFGHVQVVRERQTGDVYAMKVLRKNDTLSKQNVAFYEEERDIMAKSNSPWITQLQYAFQDKNNIYLVMEYHPGGNLFALLERFDNIFSEKMARFYLAEIALAINTLHNMGYVHRDIKPENVLLDRTGHVKLADFGSAAKLTVHGTVISKMPVGTPDYVAPEILVCLENNSGTYGQSCDWWSLGIVAYEMLYGDTPFADDRRVTVYSKIMNHKTTLTFPDDEDVSKEAISLIRGLLDEIDSRLSYSQILQHPFFGSLNLDAIRDTPPPYVPVVLSQDDTSNFGEQNLVAHRPDFSLQDLTGFSGRNLPFVGFTYTKLPEVPEESVETARAPSIKRLSNFSKQIQELMEKNLALEKQEAINFSEIRSLKRRLKDEESALYEAKSVIEKLNKKISNSNSEVVSLKKVREIEQSERLKTESKSLEILEKIKGKWKRDSIEKDLAFQKERDCLLLLVKKCNENYNNELNEKSSLQKKYDSLLKVAETLKSQSNASEKVSRRSFSTDMKEMEKLHKQITTLQRNLEDANDTNKLLEEKLNNAQGTTRELELQVNKLEQASKNTENSSFIWEKKLSTSINDLQERLNEAQQHVSDLKTELRNRDIDMEVMDKKIKFLCFQNEKLEDRVKTVLSEKSSDGEKEHVTFAHGIFNKDVEEELKLLKDENKELMEELIQWKQSEMEKSVIVEDLRNHVSILEEGYKQSSLESFFSASSGSEDEARIDKDDRIAALCSEIMILKAKISNSETQLERSKENLVRERKETRETRSELYKVERELKDVKIDARIAQRDFKTASEQLKDYQSKELELQNERDKALKQISELELSLSKSESELRKMTLKYEYSEKRWDTGKCKFEQQIENLKASNTDLKAAQVKSNQAEGRIAELLKQIEVSEKQIRTLELEAKEWLEAKTKMKENLKQEIEKRQNQELNANVLRTISTDLEDQVQKHEALAASHEAEEQKLKDELSSAAAEIRNTKVALVKAESSIEMEKSKLVDANKRINELERQLELENVVQDKEMNTVVCQKNEYRANVVKLTQDVALLDEELKTKEYDIASCLKKIDLLTEEGIRVKEETALLITQIQSLRETNFKLSSGLEESIIKAEELKEQLSERESTLQETRTSHQAEKLKLTETMAQQTKLINFLQAKVDTPVKKKKTLQEKLFGKKQTVVVTPSLTKKPHYKIEMSPSKIYTYPGKRKDDLNSVDDSVKDALTLSKSPTIREGSGRHRPQKSNHSGERMHHNIPHRFNIGLCVHPTKCAVCLDTINFGRNVARCLECNVPVHPKCTQAIPDTCSLPIGLMQHYRHSMKKPKKSNSTSVSDTIEANDVGQDSSICGWLKMSKSGNHGWDRVFVKLKGKLLLAYHKEDIGDRDIPVTKLDVSPSDGIVKVIEVVLPNELCSQAKSDLPFIFKLESQPLTTCWPGSCLYLMANSLSEKLNWVSTLEKVANANPNVPKDDCGDIGTVLMSITDVENVDLNCATFLDDDTFLIGAEEGLYVVDLLNNGNRALITHFISIISIHVVTSLKIVLIITGTDHRLYWIEISVLRKILNGSVRFMAEALQLLHPVENIDSCHLIVTSETGGNVMLCAAISDKISILKWNSQLKSFFLRRVLSTTEPCGCALFTSDSLIMGTDKFYEIDLQTFTVENFLDETDVSLKHIVMGAVEMQSFPVAIFQIALNGLPEEYLVCYNEIGVFVDSFGHRSRPQDVTWTRIPLGFAFRWPYLYIIHFNSVEVRKIKLNRDACFEMQTHVEIASPRYMGFGVETGTIVIATLKDDAIEVSSFDGEIAVKRRLNRLLTDDRQNGNENLEDSDSEVANFSFTSSILEALGESEL